MSRFPTPAPKRPLVWGLPLTLAAIVIGGGWFWWHSRGTVKPRPLAIIVSGDTAGWIMPCGCTSNQSGGLARRGTYFEQARAAADVIVADVGGAASGTSAYDLIKFRAILAGEKLMRIAAHNLGAAELLLGVDQLRKLAVETSVPLVSANARDTNGALIAPALILHEAGDRRVAIVGVLSPQFATPQISVSDPRTAILNALSEAKGRLDAVIVLAYLPTEELESLASELPEADLVIGGPTQQSIAPRQVGRTLLAAVTAKGKFLAHVVAPEDRALPWHGKIVEVDAALADHAAQLANIEQFHRDLDERDLAASDTGFVSALAGAVPRGNQIAGTESCLQCHTEDGQHWQASGHAQAWSTLVKSGAQVDAYCQHCHTTGFGLPGGFISARRSLDRTNVGCESCHGPSLAHVMRSETKTPFAARDQCATCHDRENSPEFAYESYWPQIDHGVVPTTAIIKNDSATENSP